MGQVLRVSLGCSYAVSLLRNCPEPMCWEAWPIALFLASHLRCISILTGFACRPDANALLQ
jgi:hypothetical protein